MCWKLREMYRSCHKNGFKSLLCGEVVFPASSVCLLCIHSCPERLQGSDSLHLKRLCLNCCNTRTVRWVVIPNSQCWTHWVHVFSLVPKLQLPSDLQSQSHRKTLIKKVASFLSTLPTPCQLCIVDAQDICFVAGNRFWNIWWKEGYHRIFFFFFPKSYNLRQISVHARRINLTEKCKLIYWHVSVTRTCVALPSVMCENVGRRVGGAHCNSWAHGRKFGFSSMTEQNMSGLFLLHSSGNELTKRHWCDNLVGGFGASEICEMPMFMKEPVTIHAHWQSSFI